MTRNAHIRRPMICREFAAVAALLAALAVMPIAAADEARINFQGRLVDVNKAPVTGSQVIAFRLWTQPFPGSPDETLLWARAYSLTLSSTGAVERQGCFSVLLGDAGTAGIDAAVVNGGDSAPLAATVDAALAAGDTYLGMARLYKSGQEWMSEPEIYPRRQLLSAPYALYADKTVGQTPSVAAFAPRFKSTPGNSVTTENTDSDHPTVVAAQIAEFALRKGSALKATYSSEATFMSSTPSTVGRVTLAVLTEKVENGLTKTVELKSIRQNLQYHDDYIMTVRDNTKTAAYLACVVPDAAADGDAKVKVVVTLSCPSALARAAETVNIALGSWSAQGGVLDQARSCMTYSSVTGTATPLTARVRPVDTLVFTTTLPNQASPFYYACAPKLMIQYETFGRDFMQPANQAGKQTSVSIALSQFVPGITYSYWLDWNSSHVLGSFTLAKNIEYVSVSSGNQRLCVQEITAEQLATGK